VTEKESVYKEDKILYLLKYLVDADEREEILYLLVDILRKENRLLRKALKL